jgi:uncharacterized protein (TIGR02594 family)
MVDFLSLAKNVMQKSVQNNGENVRRCLDLCSKEAAEKMKFLMSNTCGDGFGTGQKDDFFSQIFGQNTLPSRKQFDVKPQLHMADTSSSNDAPIGTSPGNLELSNNGIDLIGSFEGLRLDAYQCDAGVWTIGYGHTGSDVHPGQHISESRAKELLRQDVESAENAVKDLVDVPLSQGQFDALVSFTFNCGKGALAKSTLLEKLNSGDYEGAQAEFGRFVHAGGVELPGLVRRRKAEAELFGNQKPDNSESAGSNPKTEKTGNREYAGSYTVKSGDCLSVIAQQHGVSLDALIAANPQIENPDLIYPNQVINIPSSGSIEKPSSGSTEKVGAGDDDWMEIAKGELGQAEIAGAKDNPRIVEYHDTTTLHAKDDETPWCSSFVNWAMEKSGNSGTDDARAISWASWGQESELEPGSVVVIRNRSTGQNHVGFYVEGQAGNLTLLGGNQSNTVKTSTFGGSYDIIAVRRPVGQ